MSSHITPPVFDPNDFSAPANVTNQYFPLPGGLILSYEAIIIDAESGEEESERNDHFATFDTKLIAGVDSAVARDTAYEDGVLVEDTLDWYAQDDFGNVWYMGEISINYNYDDDGEFIGTDFGGSWEAGIDGAQPGYIMLSAPVADANYYQEFYEDVAEDEGTVVATGLAVEVGGVVYNDVIKIKDTSELEPDSGAFKYFAPGFGMIFEEELILPGDEIELTLELQNVRYVDNSPMIDNTGLGFDGDGSDMTVTFLTEDANVNGAVGAYLYDTATGLIGEARILFADTEDVAPGEAVTINVPNGMSLGLFLVPDVEDLGLDLEDYMDGGLWFANPLSGDVADIYDGNPDTTYTPGPAYIDDGLSPLVTDGDGNILPIRAFHSAGSRGDYNFLNHVAGKNAMVDDASGVLAGVDVVSFEDGLASTEDYDADFDDAFVAVSAAPLSEDDLEDLLDDIGISRLVGTDGRDVMDGTDDDDQLIGLEGNDRLNGGEGDDQIEGSDGNDRLRGGEGDDEIDGEDGNDSIWGDEGEDEIDGGDGNDWLSGGDDDDVIEGGEGHDTLLGGDGFDELLGGEGKDKIVAGGDGARMAGGGGDDTLTGEAGAADTFVFDLIELGNDVVIGFEDGTDVFEIATYTGVTEFADIEVTQLGGSAILSFAGGTVKVDGVDMSMIDASDFAFV